MANTKPRLSKGQKGTSAVMMEHQMKMLAAITCKLFEDGYRPVGIETAGTWKHPDGSYHFAAFVTIRVTGWGSNEFTEFHDYCTDKGWSYRLYSEQGTENVYARIFT